MPELITLGEFIQDKQKEYAGATGELSAVLRNISIASKIVARVINRAGLTGILGTNHSSNHSGEDQQKLDVYANDWFKRILQGCEECCGFASEEEEDYVSFLSKEENKAKYLVIFDPLDGSSNIDVNISIGTIFSVFKRKSEMQRPCELDDFLQQGLEQVASGYILYGTSTMMVYTTGDGVNGFTLYPSIGEFCLSHPNIRIPERGGYSINQGYYHSFPDHIRRYVDKRKENTDSLRFVGSMVADVHRILLRGGVFIYPSLKGSHPNGKLRLMYECNPLSFLIEQAGGKATNEEGIPILSLKAESLHQRTSILIGSILDVEDALNA